MKFKSNKRLCDLTIELQPVTKGIAASVYKRYDAKGNLVEWREDTGWIVIKKDK